MASSDVKLNIRKGTATSHNGKMKVEQPHLWTPESPYLYNLCVRIYDKNGM